MADRVRIVEVGPRDGLQNEKAAISVADKLRLIALLRGAGCLDIEVGAMVSPKWVPQMAGSAEVIAALPTPRPYRAHVLVPNLAGLDRLPDGVDVVSVFVAASEGFSKANLNADMVTGLQRAGEVARAARDKGYEVRGYISCLTECPYDGPTPPSAVARAVAALRQAGAREVSLGDTIGRAVPDTLKPALEAALGEAPSDALAGHFHDTGGRALENVEASMALGLRVFDAAVGGLGGCPYAPGAPGNLATEALCAFLDGRGIDTGIDQDALAKAAAFAQSLRGKGPP